jgi:HPt (histidine-containing phosphotransfer) domain-containing protein
MEMTPDSMETANRSQVAEAMNRLWAQFLPQIEERVATLELAARALAGGTLTTPLREQAGAAAHKLAGTLGTFGLSRGTELARQAEQLYATDLSALEMNGRPAALASELRVLVASRK